MSGEKNLRIEVPSPGADLVIVEGPIPECPPYGVVIKTTNAGICHSDVHIWRDQWRVTDDIVISMTQITDKVKWPMVIGHEISGTVHAIGQDASGEPNGLKIGDRVVVYPWIGCGECATCKDGGSSNCPVGGAPTDIGIGATPGGYQSYLALEKKRHVLKVPDSIPSNVACMFGCSALTAYHAVSRVKPSIERASKRGEAHFLIIGAGGLGLWCIQIARALYPSHTKIFVADIDEEKLALAKDYGADEVILWSRQGDEMELIERTKQITGGIDGSADFVGIPSTTARAFESTNKGATMAVVGLSGGTFPVSLFTLIVKDVTVTGTYVGSRQQMAEFVELYRSKQIKPPPLINIDPKDANEAIHKLHQGKVLGRSIINFP